MSLSAPPLRIGPYSIARPIGAGATADVYLAVQDESFITVALKQYRKTSQDEAHKQMFLAEVEMGKMMHHKNIVRVFDANLAEKSGAYLVMEYVQGVSMDHYENGDTLLPIRTVLSAVEQVAHALRYAASLGVVHRDVKPANIILTPNGTAKLTDFGCAVPQQRMGYVVAGSLAYMSPEQLEGKALDQRADIYSLGAVLYRLLTGKHTFEAESNFEARIAILNFPIIPIQKFRRGLPPELIAVIERALKKEAAERYADWDEFLRDFGNIAQKIKMSDEEYDLYRGFSFSTQDAILERMESDQQFSRSGFSRSAMPGSWA